MSSLTQHLKEFFKRATLTKGRVKITWSSQQMQKKHLTKFNTNKDFQQSRYKRNLPQHDKSHLKQNHRYHHTQWYLLYYR